MARTAYHTLDVFTDARFGGNPLAVFPDGGAVPPALMQVIARELNLSETVFILPPERGGTHRLRIFTPAVELPFAGHPTLGAALLLAWTGDAPANGYVFEESAGDISVTAAHGAATMTLPQPAERLDGAPPPDVMARVVGLAASDVRATAICSAGVPFTFVEAADSRAVARARLNRAAWRESVANTAAPNLHIFTRPAPGEIHARMFGPGMGIAEDPATGAAAAALSALLPPGRHTIRQGLEMGRPSTLLLDVGAPTRLSGRGVRIADATMTVG